MADSNPEVLRKLNDVRAPDGTPLPATRTLSDIIVSNGKVFFSISVDATMVPKWEGVRKAAEAAVRALPGVTSVMVALTAERAAGKGDKSGAPPVQGGHRPTPQNVAPASVKAMIAVASGKGGVG